MQLIDLPEEILLMIIQDLDLHTLESLYNTSILLRHIVCSLGVIRDGRLTCSAMATANKLKTSFFKDIAHHLVELNMCGVPDLCKTAFLPVLKKLKKLKVLDVSYTNLNISDLQDIHSLCPTLIDISINFPCCKCAKVPKHIMMQCQSVFEHFNNIHFVGSIFNLLYFKMALYLIGKATLHSLKYTIADKNCIKHTSANQYDGDARFPHFNQFTIYVLNWNIKMSPNNSNFGHGFRLNQLPVLSMLEMCKFECIVISVIDFEPRVYASPIFKDFFKDKFNVTILCIDDCEIPDFRNTVIMLWNKQTIQFDKYFYDALLKKVKQYIPHYINLQSDSNMLSDPANHNWFYDVPMTHICAQQNSKKEIFGMDRKRQAKPIFTLDYDKIFKEKDCIELTLHFKFPIISTISLSANCDYLKKLTFLSFIGLGQFSADFFNTLFHCCKNLTTLNVESRPVAPAALAICRSLSISTSLKNLRLVLKRVDMKALFSSFSQCPNLENIHIVDESEFETNNLADPSALIEKCDGLYNIYLEAILTDVTTTKTMRLFNKAKAKFHKPYVTFTICNRSQLYSTGYNPFVGVFRLASIRPL